MSNTTTSAATKLFRNLRKGDRFTIPLSEFNKDTQIYRVLKIGKGYGTTEKKATVTDHGWDDEDFTTNITAEGDLCVTLV